MSQMLQHRAVDKVTALQEEGPHCGFMPPPPNQVTGRPPRPSDSPRIFLPFCKMQFSLPRMVRYCYNILTAHCIARTAVSACPLPVLEDARFRACTSGQPHPGLSCITQSWGTGAHLFLLYPYSRGEIEFWSLECIFQGLLFDTRQNLQYVHAFKISAGMM